MSKKTRKRSPALGFGLGGVLVLVVLQSTNGCSVLLKDDGVQCSVDADCEKRGFLGARCDSGVCQSASSGGGGGGTPATAGNAGNNTSGKGNTNAGGAPTGDSGAAGALSDAGAGAGGMPAACGDTCGDPIGLGVTGAAALPVVGTLSAGTDHFDLCPANQLLVGIRFYLGTRTNYEYFQRAQAICGEASLASGSSPAVEITRGPLLVQRGVGFADDMRVETVCPPNQAVVGYAGYKQAAGVQAARLSCAPLTVTGTSGSYSVAPGTVTELDWAGPITGGEAVATTTCKAGQVARGLSLGADNSIRRFGTFCGTPTLLYPDGAPCQDSSECNSANCDGDICRETRCRPQGGCTCTNFNGLSYMFCSSASFAAASVQCQSSKSLLVAPKDALENGWLRTTATFDGFANVYLGGTDSMVEGRWVWDDAKSSQFWKGVSAASGGSAVGGLYSNWGPTEPSTATADTDCLVLRTDESWAAQECGLASPFVCRAD